MSDIIQLLSDSVANQIAAGEVIQRPASVVKELLENSIDAGASKIQLILKDSGRTLIQVIDNGKGMSPTDARMSFERHATSKIREASDLFSIHTFGFRGEALASIASVAEVELKTRRKEDELGTLLLISASDVLKQEPVSCGEGTSFSVKNLFFNVPARRKFLKSNATELKNIVNEIERVALANPEITFSISHNGSLLYELPSDNIKKRIIALFGKNMSQALVNLNVDTSIAKITGYVGLPKFARRSFGEQFFFVNNRYMKHPYFHRGVLQAYERILPKEMIPSYFIFLEVDPASIDINIHPTKTEIKFENEREIWQLIYASVRESLGKSNVVPSIDFDQQGSVEIPLPPKQFEGLDFPNIEFDPTFNPFNEQPSEERFNTSVSNGNTASFRGLERSQVGQWQKLYNVPTDSPEPELISAEIPSEEGVDANAVIKESQQVRNFIILKNKYIITPVKSGLMLIDYRRAHQRILYEQFCSQLSTKQCVSQQLLFPQTIETSYSDALVLCSMLDDLNAIGFDICEFGSQTFVINGIPALLNNADPKSVIDFLLEQYKSTGGSICDRAMDQLAEQLALSTAVGQAHTLSSDEAAELIDTLFACKTPNFSPSGKPIIEIIPMEEFEKRMK